VIVGALGTEGRAVVDARGAIRIVGEPWTLDWWIGADDRWRVPAREPAVRHAAVEGTPVAETRMRVPSGDAVQRVYGIGGVGDVVVVEVENASPAACVVTLVVRGATSLAMDGTRVLVDGRVALVLPFAPPRWDVTDLALEPEQCGAETGPVPARTFAEGALVAALLFPLSHRNRLRVGLVCGEEIPTIDLAQVPAADAAARGWHHHLGHATRVIGPGERVAEIDLARSQVLLEPDPGAATTAALEDWGFDERAEWAWNGLSGRDRRRARKRVDLMDDPGAAGLLLRARDGWVRDVASGIEILHAPPEPGVDIEIRDAPTRHGTISFALRWHGEHPALLWEVSEPTSSFELRAPGVVDGWSTRDPVGETLLRPAPA
jgi:hypothetical protein